MQVPAQDHLCSQARAHHAHTNLLQTTPLRTGIVTLLVPGETYEDSIGDEKAGNRGKIQIHQTQISRNTHRNIKQKIQKERAKKKTKREEEIKKAGVTQTQRKIYKSPYPDDWFICVQIDR